MDEDERYEGQMDDKRAENGNDRDRGGGGPRVDRRKLVELAGSSGFRSTHHHVLAGTRHSDTEQDPLRRSPRSARLRRTLETAYERALGTDEPRGARKISP